MHAGHVELFEFCSKLGKVIVGINSDKYLNEKYGPEKTVPLDKRVYVIKSCKYVDEVIAFSENEPSKLIERIKPDFYAKGPDYKDKKIPEDKILNLLGIKKIIQSADKILNCSDLIENVSIRDFNFFNN